MHSTENNESATHPTTLHAQSQCPCGTPTVGVLMAANFDLFGDLIIYKFMEPIAKSVIRFSVVNTPKNFS